MNKNIRLVLPLLLLLFLNCLNEEMLKPDGSTEIGHFPPFRLKDVLKPQVKSPEELSRIAMNRRYAWEEHPDDYRYASDYAVALARKGEVKEAWKLLAPLARLHPEAYSLQSNLGTIYELMGNIDSALYFIQKGVALNNKSHEGSEWIHVKILQVKKKLAADPDYLKTHTVLELGIGNVQTYYKEQIAGLKGSRENKLRELFDLNMDLGYQLKERLFFIAPQDPIMADLLLDFARLTAIVHSVNDALPVYQKCLLYGPTNANEVSRELASLLLLIPEVKKRQEIPKDKEYNAILSGDSGTRTYLVTPEDTVILAKAKAAEIEAHKHPVAETHAHGDISRQNIYAFMLVVVILTPIFIVLRKISHAK